MAHSTTIFPVLDLACMTDKFTQLWATKNKDDEWWSSFVTSPLAIGLNYLVIDVKWLTPNLITLLSFLTAVISALFIIAGGTSNFLIAALLINLSHIFDCMDGQMARYRKTSSPTGSYFDRLTDQLQIITWFGAVAYAAFNQTHSVVPVFLAFIGVAFYSLRGYVKYVAIHTQMSADNRYLDKLSEIERSARPKETAGPGFGFKANLKWLIAEQKKIIHFNEGVFIFMLSLALALNMLTPMLWVFAISQLVYGIVRGFQAIKIIDGHTAAPFEK
jgi:phosphatidylglycerophosphate synthase